MSTHGRNTSARTALLLGAVVFLGAASAQAQIARVFVSVNGNDANPCETISTPCRTLSAGISRVDANGEVIVLDNGSYGGTTITKAVRINVPSGVIAFAAQPFVVNAPDAVVVLRGLTVKALTLGSGIGVIYTAAAALYVESCVLDGWNSGIRIDGTGELFVKDSTFRNMSNIGLLVNPPSAALTAMIDTSRFENNGTGVVVDAGQATMRNGVLSGNSGQGAISQGAFGSVTALNIDKCLLANNSLIGLSVVGAMGVARISNSIVTGNGTGVQNFGGGAVLKSWGNNAVDGNTTNTVGTITTIALQ